MKRVLLAALALVASPCAFGQYVTLTGTLQSTNGMPAPNYVLQFTPSQFGFVAGTGVIVNTSTYCGTSFDGSVVGVPNPAIASIVTPSFTGALPAGNYYVEYAWQTSGGTVTLPSPESVVNLSATGSIIVAPPPTGAPGGATQMNVYIATASGAETFQGSITAGTSYQQSAAIIVGSAVPAANNTVCKQIANDVIWPVGTGYLVSLTDSNGNSVPGYPMTWQLLGANTTIDVSNGLPYYHGIVTYPVPILASPFNHGQQSISGPLNLSNYNLTGVGKLGVGTNVPAFSIDVENGKVNASGGYLAHGSAGTSGQCLGSDGTAFNTAVNCITSLTINYQTITANGTAQTQRPVLNFSPQFTITDSGSPARTTVTPAVTGVGAGSYTCANLTVDAFGRTTAATNGSCNPAFTGTSGYQALPSGLILEWATGVACTSDCTQTVNFPSAFPHACLTVMTTNNNASGTNIVKDWGFLSCSTTSVSLQLQRRGDEGSWSAIPMILAVGW